MKKILALGASVLLLSGCALPAPVSVAIWLFDGLSYLQDEKTSTDLMVTVAAGRDCEVARMVEGMDVCHDFDAMVADNAAQAAPETGPAAIAPSEAEVAFGIAPASEADLVAINGDGSLSDFITASGPEAAIQAQAAPVEPVETVQMSEPVSEIQLAAAQVTEETPLASPQAAVFRAEGDAKKLYYVIGSYAGPTMAFKRADAFPELGATVLSANLDGKTYYRVVVGPFLPTERRQQHKRIVASGVEDAWAIRMDGIGWQSHPVSEVAALH